MLDRITIHQHRVLDTGKALDSGLLAETLLLYGKVEVPLNDQVLRQLIQELTFDGVLELIERDWLQLSYRSQFAAINTDTEPDGRQKHAPITAEIIKPSGAVVGLDDLVIPALIEYTGQEGGGRSMARRLLPHITTSPFPHDLLMHVKEDIEDPVYSTLAAVTSLRTYVPEYTLPANLCFQAKPVGEHYEMSTNLDFPAVNRLYHARVPTTHPSITAGLILSIVLNTRLALEDAAIASSDITSDPVFETLSAHRVNSVIESSRVDLSQVQALQSFVFDGPTVLREAINSGDRSLKDFLPVLRNSDRFRKWLRDKPFDGDLVKQYFRDCTASTWVDQLPAKSIRFSIFTGLGLLIDSLGAGGAGTAVGIALGAGDTFLLDRMIGGWKPNQYVEGPLASFIRPAR